MHIRSSRLVAWVLAVVGVLLPAAAWGATDAADIIAFLAGDRLTTSRVNAALERFNVEESAAHPHALRAQE